MIGRRFAFSAIHEPFTASEFMIWALKQEYPPDRLSELLPVVETLVCVETTLRQLDEFRAQTSQRSRQIEAIFGDDATRDSKPAV